MAKQQWVTWLLGNSLALAAPALGVQPVLHYSFGDSSNGEVDVLDLGQEPAANGQYVGQVDRTIETPNGFKCYAIDLTANDSTNNYVTTGGDIEKIDTLSEMTITLWFNLRGDPVRDDCLLSDRPVSFPVPPAGTGGWQLTFAAMGGGPNPANDASVSFGMYKSLGTYGQGQGQFITGIDADHKWVFLALVFDDRNTLFSYLGDESTAIVSKHIPTVFSHGLLPNDDELRIGSATFDPDDNHTPPAWMDDVRIYDVALTEQEIDRIRRENIMYLNLDAVPGFHPIYGVPGESCTGFVQGVSGDGSTIVGTSRSAFRWRNGVMSTIGDLPGGHQSSVATRTSDNGEVVVGWGSTDDASQAGFRWENDTFTPLGDLPGGDMQSPAYSVSGDGSIVIGNSTTDVGFEPYRWEAGQMIPLSPFLPDTPSFAQDISRDGTIIAGATQTETGVQGLLWHNVTATNPGQHETIGDLPGGDEYSVIYAISADGSTVVGISKSDAGEEAIRWKNGRLESLGDLPGGIVKSTAWAVSGNGSIVVGSGETDLDTEAFIWDADNGMRNLKEVLEVDYGLDLTGWTLESVIAISDDGTVLTGMAWNPFGRLHAWRALLPGPVFRPDLDDDGDVDLDDVELFEACATGPEVPYDPTEPPAGCILVPDDFDILPADLDRDGDIDQEDFGLIQRCISGEAVPFDIMCLDD